MTHGFSGLHLLLSTLQLSNSQTTTNNTFTYHHAALDDDIFFPKDKIYLSKDDQVQGIGRCSGTIHTSPERLLAFLFFIDTDWDTSKHIKQNGPDTDKFPNKSVQRANFHSNVYYSCRKMVFPLHPRDWLLHGLFNKIEDDKYVLAWDTIDVDEIVGPHTFKESTLKERIRGLYVSERGEASEPTSP